MKNRHSPRYCNRGRIGNCHWETGKAPTRTIRESGHPSVAVTWGDMHRSSIVIAVVLCRASFARADERAGIKDETIVITDDRPAEINRDGARALGDAPFVTVLHPDEHGAAATVADAAATAPGVQVRSLGGLGSYQSISIRGAAPGHTAVLVDGIPLARLAEVTTDLGRFALASFARVDIYRGAVPIELGGAGVGGAVNLITRVGPGEHGERVSASAGYGSYGARHLRAHYGDTHAHGLESSVTVGYTGASGDYTFFDNHDTQLNKSDDGYTRRGNNGFAQVDGAARLATGATSGGVRVAYKGQGLPGTTSLPAPTARLGTLDAIGDTRVVRAIGGALATGALYGLVERQALHDPHGELGLGVIDHVYTTLSGGATTTWSARRGTARGSIGAELRGDRFHESDRAGGKPGVTGDREGAALLAELEIALAPQLEITPAIRLDAVRTVPAAITVGPMQDATPAPRSDVVPSPRLTARFALRDDVTLKGSAGYYVRLPTLVELFGNRGYVIGTPDLRPERGPNGDFGAVWAPPPVGPLDRVLVEADLFATHARDTISFVTFAGYIARAINIGRTQTYGGELAVTGRIARAVSLTASYTRLATEQITDDVTLAGRALPRTPGHRLYARADVSQRVAERRLTAWFDTAYQATSFLDPANLGRVPARALFGAGASAEIAGGVTLAVSVENLAGTRVVDLPLVPPPGPAFTSTPIALADLAGFPLPGRSFYVSVLWTH